MFKTGKQTNFRKIPDKINPLTLFKKNPSVSRILAEVNEYLVKQIFEYINKFLLNSPRRPPIISIYTTTIKPLQNDMKEHEQIFHQLQQMAEAVVAMFGKNCETCIHDLQDLHCSLVYICGSVTGRAIGAPATDLLVKTLKNAKKLEDMHNYRTTSGDGRTLKSSTIFIKDSNNIPIFAFCINFDTSDFFNARQALFPFLAHEENNNGHNFPETFSQSTNETIEALFKQAVLDIGKQPVTMSIDEKVALVEILENNGAFQFKSAVEQIALLIGVSKYTIYNYLKKIHARQAVNHLG